MGLAIRVQDLRKVTSDKVPASSSVATEQEVDSDPDHPLNRVPSVQVRAPVKLFIPPRVPSRRADCGPVFYPKARSDR